MVSFASALLDELMGRNRNNDPNEKPKDLNWADQEVSYGKFYNLLKAFTYDLPYF